VSLIPGQETPQAGCYKMKNLNDVLRKINNAGAGIAGVFLIAIMVLIVANVIVRFFQIVIEGTYELIELLIVVTVAFALAYTAFHGGHVVVRVLVSRFSERTQAIMGIFTNLIAFGTCGAITWASAIILQTRWITETSNVYGFPIFPFRIIWQVGLLLLCFMLFTDLIKALNRAVRK
jgi:TRAP-type C4-dicarboxylate transport system permease small subunit